MSKFIEVFDLTRYHRAVGGSSRLHIDAYKSLTGWHYQVTVTLTPAPSNEEPFEPKEAMSSMIKTQADAFQWGQDKIIDWVMNG